MSQFLRAFILTILLEFVLAIIFVAVGKIRARFLFWNIIGNAISHPIVWFVFPNLMLGRWTTLASESFAVTLEALFLFFAMRKTLSFWIVLVFTLGANMFSFFVGEWILYPLGMMS